MLRRRSRPDAAPAPRPNAIRVLAGRPAVDGPTTGDLLPSTAGRHRTRVPAPTPAPPPAPTAPAAPPARLGPPTVDERAARIRAMTQAARRRAAAGG
jgi:hypothetical protein